MNMIWSLINAGHWMLGLPGEVTCKMIPEQSHAAGIGHKSAPEAATTRRKVAALVPVAPAADMQSCATENPSPEDDLMTGGKLAHSVRLDNITHITARTVDEPHFTDDRAASPDQHFHMPDVGTDQQHWRTEVWIPGLLHGG